MTHIYIYVHAIRRTSSMFNQSRLWESLSHEAAASRVLPDILDARLEEPAHHGPNLCNLAWLVALSIGFTDLEVS